METNLDMSRQLLIESTGS